MESINIKLINTVLCGCEYIIENNNNLFIIVNQEWLKTSDSLTVPEYGILVPVEWDSDCNFSIVLPTEQQPDYQLVVHYRDDNKQDKVIPLQFNHIYTIDKVKLVTKLANSAWSYHKTVPEKDYSAPISYYSNIKRVFTCLLRFNRKYLLLLFFTLLLLLCASYFWYQQTEPARRLQSITNLFLNNDKVVVLLGADGYIYIITDRVEQISVVHALLKSQTIEFSDLIKVNTLNEERARIIRWLARCWPQVRWNAIDFDNIQQPVIYLSQQRAKPFTTESRQQFIAQIQRDHPYIKDIVFSYLDDRTLINQARYGLEQLNLHYQQQVNPFHSAFIIEGELNDADLLRLKRFVTGFYQQWGDSYIKFIVTLHRDFLKHYSFKGGVESYVKLSTNHWYITN